MRVENGPLLLQYMKPMGLCNLHQGNEFFFPLLHIYVVWRMADLPDD